MHTPRSFVVMFAALAACATLEKPGSDEETGAEVEEPAVDGTVERLDFGSFAPRNIVVVTVDTLRADAMAPWGSRRETMPRMAERPGWVSVERAVSTASWTVPATASLLTARDLPAHGLRYFDEGGSGSTLLVANYVELLRQQGFRTGLFSGSELVMSGGGLGTGFEVTQVVETDPGNTAATVASALSWIEADDSGKPFFVYLHPVDPHGPYEPEAEDQGVFVDPESVPFSLDAPVSVQESQISAAVAGAPDAASREAILAAVRGVYDEQLLGVDRGLEALIAGLERLGHGDDTLVIVTADHGESFYDGVPSHLGHGAYARNEIVRIPLLFWGGGLETAHVPCVASNMDVLPTAAAAVGVNGPDVVDGQSLLTACRPVAFSGVYEYEEEGEVLTWLSAENATTQVVVDCTTGERSAYDLVNDPLATESLPVVDVAEAAEVASRLDTYIGRVVRALPHLSCDR